MPDFNDYIRQALDNPSPEQTAGFVKMGMNQYNNPTPIGPTWGTGVAHILDRLLGGMNTSSALQRYQIANQKSNAALGSSANNFIYDKSLDPNAINSPSNSRSGAPSNSSSGAAPNQAVSSVSDPVGQQSSYLKDERQRLAQELQDPRIKEAFKSLAHAEVGDQGDKAILGFYESVANRALSRGKSLSDTIYDRNYFPKVTMNRMNNGVPKNMSSVHDDAINNLMNGSNITGFSTGNASGKVGFAGGPRTASFGGENYGQEGPDAAWVKRATAENAVRESIAAKQVNTKVAENVNPTTATDAPQALGTINPAASPPGQIPPEVAANAATPSTIQVPPVTPVNTNQDPPPVAGTGIPGIIAQGSQGQTIPVLPNAKTAQKKLDEPPDTYAGRPISEQVKQSTIHIGLPGAATHSSVNGGTPYGVAVGKVNSWTPQAWNSFINNGTTTKEDIVREMKRMQEDTNPVENHYMGGSVTTDRRTGLSSFGPSRPDVAEANIKTPLGEIRLPTHTQFGPGGESRSRTNLPYQYKIEPYIERLIKSMLPGAATEGNTASTAGSNSHNSNSSSAYDPLAPNPDGSNPVVPGLLGSTGRNILNYLGGIDNQPSRAPAQSAAPVPGSSPVTTGSVPQRPIDNNVVGQGEVSRARDDLLKYLSGVTHKSIKTLREEIEKTRSPDDPPLSSISDYRDAVVKYLAKNPNK